MIDVKGKDIPEIKNMISGGETCFMGQAIQEKKFVKS